jgi:hypothetical protein
VNVIEEQLASRVQHQLLPLALISQFTDAYGKCQAGFVVVKHKEEWLKKSELPHSQDAAYLINMDENHVYEVYAFLRLKLRVITRFSVL